MSMKLTKLKAASLGPKIDHPLAKYNSKGDVYCLLCNTLIKNANVWKVHLSSKVHKENLILFKAGKVNSSESLKRPAPKTDVAPPRSLKKMKSDTPAENVMIISETCAPSKDNDVVNTNIIQFKPGILKQSSKVVPKLPEGFVPKSRVKNPPPIVNSTEQIRAVEVKSNLPMGFFDDNIALTVDAHVEELDDTKKLDEEENTQSDNRGTPASNLPDGFFDDAREDAKARKVEYKDPQEVEWDKFQSEMEQEDIRYNTILEEDHQKLREERDIDIGIEQKLWDYRVESIATSAKTGEVCIADKQAFEVKLGKLEKFELNEFKKEEKEEISTQSIADYPADMKMEDDSLSSDEDDDVMDWRTKRGL